MEEDKNREREAGMSAMPEEERQAGTQETIEMEIERLRLEVPKKDEELRNLQDKYLRICADFENYKKRSMKEQMESAKYANERILKELLPVIDNLERAILHSRETSDLKGLVEGVELTCKQFLDSLGRFGVKVVQSIGEPFDPSRHQALGQVESDKHDENIVIEELQKGYLLEDRMLRPALVNISRKRVNNFGDNED
ncbi:MAG TPA: nucleotide exchange factor GrpE [Nitrospiria bacterium]|nr:nucleotide exchange factor GrpE [Nitrospiria bacterium]